MFIQLVWVRFKVKSQNGKFYVYLQFIIIIIIIGSVGDFGEASNSKVALKA